MSYRTRQCSALTAALSAALLIVGCGTESGTNYTKLAVAQGQRQCGNAHLAVGDQAEPIISVTNTSGHAWKSTWLWIHGTGDLLKLEPGEGFGDTSVPAIAMDNRPADETYADASLYNFGPLPAGEVGDIHVYLTAEKPGHAEVLLGVWGNSEAKPDPELPDSKHAKGLVCAYFIG